MTSLSLKLFNYRLATHLSGLLWWVVLSKKWGESGWGDRVWPTFKNNNFHH